MRGTASEVTKTVKSLGSVIDYRITGSMPKEKWKFWPLYWRSGLSCPDTSGAYVCDVESNFPANNQIANL
jgi:hypothetical protein